MANIIHLLSLHFLIAVHCLLLKSTYQSHEFFESILFLFSPLLLSHHYHITKEQLYYRIISTSSPEPVHPPPRSEPYPQNATAAARIPPRCVHT